MSVQPPDLPQDYVLKDVTRKQKSAPEHSNMWVPRVTQTTVGIFAYPKFPLKGEKPGEYHIRPVNDLILDNWTASERAWWVDKPFTGKLVDEMSRKYTVVVQEEIDPRYKHRGNC